MKITELFLDNAPDVPSLFRVGDVVEGFPHRVKSITFYGTNHSLHGHSGKECYSIEFDDVPIRKIIPAKRMVEITVDTGKKVKPDEDVGNVVLPAAAEAGGN